MNPPLITPKALKKGDTLAIIAPAGQLADPHDLDAGIRILHDMGFHTRLPRDLWPGDGYLADSDQNRVEEFHKLLADPEVDGLIALRGGFGCLRMVGHIDYKFLRKNPKVLIGFSDITVLLSQIVEKAGVLCFHGPTVTSLAAADRQTLEKLYYTLTGDWQGEIRPLHPEVIQGGDNVTGTLMGGNLSSLVTLLGTAYDFSWQGKIIFLEDVHEPLYKIDRMLTQLHLAGKFKQVGGILLGDFTLNSQQDTLEKIRYTEQIWSRVIELVGPGTPIWGDFPVGHGSTNLPLPIGGRATMNSNLGKMYII